MATSRKTQTKMKKPATKKTATKKIVAKKITKKNPEDNCAKKFWIATGFILLPLAVGIISSLVTGNAMTGFSKFNQPPLAPPAWLFPVAWTILYVLMGVASYLIYRIKPKNKTEEKLQKTESVVYFVQLFFNFMWTILFFKFELRWFAFGWLIAMWLMIFALIFMCAKNRKAAAWCLVPYIIWCTFAAYLNVMIAILN